MSIRPLINRPQGADPFSRDGRESRSPRSRAAVSGGAGTHSRRRPLLSPSSLPLRRCPGDLAQLALPLPVRSGRCSSERHKGIAASRCERRERGAPAETLRPRAHEDVPREKGEGWGWGGGGRGGRSGGEANAAPSQGSLLPALRGFAQRNPRSSSRGMGFRFQPLHQNLAGRNAPGPQGSSQPGRWLGSGGPRSERRKSGVGLG